VRVAADRFRMVGVVRVDPPLSPAEFEYLTAFAESRRWRRPGGPYVVPGNPLAECLEPAFDLTRYAVPADGQPGLRCPWFPAQRGRALVLAHPPAGDPGASADEVAAWLRYLIDHFLRSGAQAAGSGDERFGQFSFDHVLDGSAAVCDQRTGLLTVIYVDANRVWVEPLGPHKHVAAADPAQRKAG